MNTEISAIMDQSGRVLDWANAVKYSPAELSAEDKEISAVTDAWVKELGKTGFVRSGYQDLHSGHRFRSV